MSIVTRTGDGGTTGLMFGRRVSKCHPRVEACGNVDELNAAVGMARATCRNSSLRTSLVSIQRHLVTLMGEIGVASTDLARYTRAGYERVTPSMTAKLDALARELEARNVSLKGWATPGKSLDAAALDLARTVCRRAERGLCRLKEINELHNPELIVYLNRLSDVLWLMARCVETARPRKRKRSAP